MSVDRVLAGVVVDIECGDGVGRQRVDHEREACSRDVIPTLLKSSAVDANGVVNTVRIYCTRIPLDQTDQESFTRPDSPDPICYSRGLSLDK